MRKVSNAKTLSETKMFVVTPITNGLPDNQADCEAAGYYWYGNACHLNPETPPTTWWVLGLVALVIIGGGVTVYYASQRKS